MQRSGAIRHAEKLRLMMAVLCAVILIAAASNLRREYMALLPLLGSDADIAIDLRDLNVAQLPRSATGQRSLMATCAEVLLTNAMLRMAPVLRAEVATRCDQAAEAVLADSPGFARALTLRLMTQPGMQGYAAAAAAAPFEPWPLGIRLLAVEAALPGLGDNLPPALASAVATDIGRALQSSWGPEFLAALYLRAPALRPMLVAVAESHPAAEQMAFLRAVRRLAVPHG